MLLSGHQGEIFCGNFHPDGTFLASAGFDRDICKCESMVIIKILALPVIKIIYVYIYIMH